jgi:hypothetical protein
MYTLTNLPAWSDLSNHYQHVSGLHMRDLFDDDPQRFEKFSLRLAVPFRLQGRWHPPGRDAEASQP